MAGTYDITIEQFATFRMVLNLTDSGSTPLNLADYSFTGSIKESAQSLTPIVFFTIDVLDPLVSGSIVVTLFPSQSAVFDKTRYHYDIIAHNVPPEPDEVYRILEGKAKVKLGITPV